MRVLGVDLGTSGVKLLVLDGDRHILHTQPCDSHGFAAYYDAFIEGVKHLGSLTELASIEAVGLSGQTGSYAVLEANGTIRTEISWQEPGRQEHLEFLLAALDPAHFLAETGMLQPRIASYPLPTIRYLRASIGRGCRLVQLKDYLCYRLSGRALTDPYSWRGLANPSKQRYSASLLSFVGLAADALPEVGNDQVAALTAQAQAACGLRAGTPLYVGLNDFYASLVGMGIADFGETFDVAGTSEHIGLTVEGAQPAALVRSPFPGGMYVHYGVIGASGVSLSWSKALFGGEEPSLHTHAPLFLPYLTGARAPIHDEHARGVFVGLTDKTSPDMMRLSVYEGVVFSLYHIYRVLGAPKPKRIRATGGPTASPTLNLMKASLFDAPLHTGALTCGSAIGAAVIAGGQTPRQEHITLPDPALGDRMRRRYPVWERIYGAWRDITAGMDVRELF